MNRVVVGLDVSKKSSGMAVVEERARRWHVFGFAQRVSERGFVYEATRPTKVRVELLPALPKSCSDLESYDHVVTHLLNKLRGVVRSANVGANDVHVFVEDYVHSMYTTSSSAHKLHECCGILKYMLFKEGYTNLTLVNNKTWKKDVLRSGTASKLDTVEHFAEHEPFVDTMKILNLRLMAGETVPCPSQDLADSIGVCKYGLAQLGAVNPADGGASNPDVGGASPAALMFAEFQAELGGPRKRVKSCQSDSDLEV